MIKILLLLLTTVTLNAGGVLSFHGHIVIAPPNALVRVNDPVMFVINYNANNVITAATVFVGKSGLNMLRIPESPPSYVYIDTNPLDGTVEWYAATDSFYADAASNTPLGVVPCIDGFDLGRIFQIYIGGLIAQGAIDAVPR